MNRLATLDRVLSVVDRADFGVILHLRKTPPIDALRAGARSGRTLYPTTGARIEGKDWKLVEAPDDGVVAAEGDPVCEAQAFFDRRLDPHLEAPVQQLVAQDQFIATRAHHAAMDGFSMGLWLRHQFRVAGGHDAPAVQAEADRPLELRQAASAARTRPAGPPLWTRNPGRVGARRWLTIELPGRPSAAALAAATLRAVSEWNRAHGAPSEGMNLWMPVNIRRRGSAAFGNGTSRIRVYAHTEIRRSLRSGEWAVPRDSALMRLPCVLSDPILRMYLNRPWANMGSVVFSCVEDWPGHDDDALADVEKIELIGQLHPRLPLAINAIGHRGRTWVTLTYDSGQLSTEDVSALAAAVSFAVGAPGEPCAVGAVYDRAMLGVARS